MRNYALDTKMLPKVWVTWASMKNKKFNKRFWLNCQTGKKKTTPESWMKYDNEQDIDVYGRGTGQIGCNYYTQKNDKIWVKSGTALRYAYIKYHKDIDRIEIAAIGFDTSRKEEPHSWKFIGDRFFIGRDKSIIDQHGNVVTRWFNVYKNHSAYDAKNMLSIVLRLHTTNNFVEEFKKFIGANCFTIGNGTTVNIKYDWHIQRWYTTSQKVRGKGKQQKLTDMLVEMPLTDIDDFKDKLVIKELRYGRNNQWTRELNTIVRFERINDEWCVLRAFYKMEDDTITEEWRMYISEDGINRIVSQGNDGWIPSSQVRHYWGRYTYLYNQTEAIEKCDRIKYIMSSPIDAEEYEVVDFLVTALRFSEIEQIAKLGYADEAFSITRSRTPKADIKHMFGEHYNEKGKTLLQKVGLTKHQFDTYMTYEGELRYKKRALAKMREIFGDGFKHLDNDTFDLYFNGYYNVSRHFWRGITPYATRLHFDEMKFFKNLVRLSKKNGSVYTIAHDTLSAYESLSGQRPEVDWYFEDVSDLVRAHDAITALKRIQDEERRALWDMQAAERRKKEEEKRIKLDKERKIYEYEDDNYIIRLPRDSNEIVREGSMQSICIGGYTSSHAYGNTNLFFLRKKDDAETPFYAIEMDNYKTIRQIHGSHNQWLGCNPEAIPTVIRWLRKHDIKCDEAILTCTARGYGQTRNYVPMPVVD